MKSLFVLPLLLILLFTSTVISQNFDPVAIGDKIDSLVPDAVNDTTPGLVVGVVKDGKLIFGKGYGLANLAYNIKNDTKLVYNTGSVTKQFLGYAFAMLHHQGKLSIDDPVSKYFDNWPEFKEKVTLRNLLTHTSGYRESYMMSNLAGREIGVDRLSREEILETVRRQPKLEFSPGSRYTYNSTAWVILADILEKVTGITAENWVTQNIFKPLGMADTQIETEVGEVIHNAAESYVKSDAGYYLNLDSNRAIFGAADIYSSIDDLSKWIRNFKTIEVGNKEVQDLFLESFILNDGVDAEYGLGIGVSTYRGLKRYRHTGGHEAFGTQLSYFPEHDLGIIAISNFGGSGWLNTSEIADFIFGDLMEVEPEFKDFKIDAERLKKYAGNYLSDTYNNAINITVENDTLRYNGNISLLPVDESNFRRKGSKRTYQFKDDASGNLQLIMVEGNTYKYSKFEESKPSEFELKKITGDYFSDELETIYKVIMVDGKLEVKNRWIGKIPIEPISKNVFRAPNGYYIQVIRDDSNKVLGLNVHGGRTLNVFFKKVE